MASLFQYLYTSRINWHLSCWARPLSHTRFGGYLTTQARWQCDGLMFSITLYKSNFFLLKFYSTTLLTASVLTGRVALPYWFGFWAFAVSPVSLCYNSGKEFWRNLLWLAVIVSWDVDKPWHFLKPPEVQGRPVKGFRELKACGWSKYCAGRNQMVKLNKAEFQPPLPYKPNGDAKQGRVHTYTANLCTLCTR